MGSASITSLATREGAYIGPERQLRGGKRALNLGSGDNRLEGAINLDIRVIKGVDVAADVNQLPFKASTFDEAVSINPHGFNPLESDVGRVLKPGGTLKVVGQPKNPFFRKFLRTASPEDIRALGFELVDTGPAEQAFRFGVPKTTKGHIIDTSVFTQWNFRRLP